jgi:hypothetical protein
MRPRLWIAAPGLYFLLNQSESVSGKTLLLIGPCQVLLWLAFLSMFSYITAADSLQCCMMIGPGQFNPLLISLSVKFFYMTP